MKQISNASAKVVVLLVTATLALMPILTVDPVFADDEIETNTAITLDGSNGEETPGNEITEGNVIEDEIVVDKVVKNEIVEGNVVNNDVINDEVVNNEIVLKKSVNNVLASSNTENNEMTRGGGDEGDEETDHSYDWQKVLELVVAYMGDMTFENSVDFITTVYNEAGANIEPSVEGLEELGTKTQAKVMYPTDIVISPDLSTFGIYLGSSMVATVVDGVVKEVPYSEFAGGKQAAGGGSIRTDTWLDWSAENGPGSDSESYYARYWTWFTDTAIIIEGDIPEWVDGSLPFAVSYDGGLGVLNFGTGTKNFLDDVAEVGLVNGVLDLPLTENGTAWLTVSGFVSETQVVTLTPILPRGWTAEMTAEGFDVSPIGNGGAIINFTQTGVSKSAQDAPLWSDRTIRIRFAHKTPGISSYAADSDSGSKEIVAGEKNTILDTISFSDFDSGATYTVVATLWDKASGEQVLENGEPLSVTETVVPLEDSGSFTVKIPFSYANLSVASGKIGSEFVVFQEVYDSDGNLVASERDIDNADQTVKITVPEKPVVEQPKVLTPEPEKIVPTGDSGTATGAAIIALCAASGALIAARRKMR